MNATLRYLCYDIAFLHTVHYTENHISRRGASGSKTIPCFHLRVYRAKNFIVKGVSSHRENGGEGKKKTTAHEDPVLPLI